MSLSPTPVISVFWVPPDRSAKSGFYSHTLIPRNLDFARAHSAKSGVLGQPACRPAREDSGQCTRGSGVVVQWYTVVVLWGLVVVHRGSAQHTTQSIGLLVARRHDYFSSPTEESEFQMVRVCGGR